MPEPISNARTTDTANQIAMFMAARDAHENGRWPDGLTHPTWDELGAAGQETYRKDAHALVSAMIRLGWAPSDRNSDGQS